MNIKSPERLFLAGGKHAVLLLHSFTGTANEMKRTAKHLHKAGFTCLAPIYAGHGQHPEKFFQTGIADWLQTAREAYLFLQQQGYEKIVIVGQSLGGVIALHLADEVAPQALVTMSSPIVERELSGLESRVKAYTTYYLRMRDIPEPEAFHFVATHFPRPEHKLHALQQFILATSDLLANINCPALILYGEADAHIYQHSAQLIYDGLASTTKQLRGYKEAGHLLSLARIPEIHDDIVDFLTNEL